MGTEATPRPAADAGATTVERIKEFILLNRLTPGSPMPTEKELSERLGVGRSRVREAMKTLSALDIVEVRHGYGTYVGALSLTAMVQALVFRSLLNAGGDEHMLIELVDLRELLECSLDGRAIDGLTAQSALAMRRLTTAMKEKASRGESFAVEDREFHRLLIGAAGNRLAEQLSEAFWDVQSLAAASLAPLGDLRSTALAHERILDAVEQGDVAAYRSAVLAHYQPIRERMRASVAAAPDGAAQR